MGYEGLSCQGFELKGWDSQVFVVPATPRVKVGSPNQVNDRGLAAVNVQLEEAEWAH